MKHGIFPSGRHTSGSGSDDTPSEISNSKEAHGQPAIEYNDDLERIHTMERVGTHAQYYEKGGLRTEGDGVNHDGAAHKVRAYDTWLAINADAAWQ